MLVELKCIFILRKNFIIKKKGGGLGLVRSWVGKICVVVVVYVWVKK